LRFGDSKLSNLRSYKLIMS